MTPDASPPPASWHLVYTKPRQESIALDNLERQGFEVFLPLYRRQKVRAGQAALVDEPLFPRYLFVRLRPGAAGGWSTVRSTRGVTSLVTFGAQVAKVPAGLPEYLMQQQRDLFGQPQFLFEPGEVVAVTGGPFAGLTGVFQMNDGEQRAMVLIEFMGKAVTLPVSPGQLIRPERALTAL